tara:strand:- start:396 stop:1100 length:705 start_codon:yes stop_codon:yes gene_type:complete
MKNKTLIFTATYNESGNIEVFIEKILRLNLQTDILIIDDNSPDETWKIIENYQKKESNIFLIKREKKLGLDTAHKTAFNYANNNDYDYLITLDADLSHDPSVISYFIEELKTNPFVIGSRYIKGGKNEMSIDRYLLSFFGNKLIKYLLKIESDEFTTSYRGFDLKKLKNFDINNVESKGYSFFMETIYLIHKSGLGIKQIPIKFKHRQIGSSKIPKIEILRTLKNLFLIKFFKS